MTATPAPVTRYKRYPAYRDSGVAWLGQIPAHWALAPVYARYEVALGKMLDAQRITGMHLGKYIRNVNVQWDRIELDDLPEMDFPPHERERFRLRAGDLLVCEGGEVGRTAMWRNELDECFYQKAVHRLRPWHDDCPRYLFYVMRAAANAGLFRADGNPNTIDHLTAVQLRHYRFAFPPLSEQHIVADFLDRETARIEAVIVKKERLVHLLEAYRTSMITGAVTTGLEPSVPTVNSGVGWLGEIPAQWKVNRLKFLLAEPLRYGANEQAELQDVHLPRFVRITDIDERGDLRNDTFRSLPVEIANDYLLEDGDVLFARSGATAGKSFLYKKSWGLCAFAGYLIRAKVARDRLLPEFLKYYTLSDSYWLWLASEFIQSTIQNVSAERFASLVVPIPPIPEQREIVGHLDQRLSKIDAVLASTRRGLSELDNLRAALVVVAVTGQIDVREEVA